jgi:hypothetical protein
MFLISKSYIEYPSIHSFRLCSCRCSFSGVAPTTTGAAPSRFRDGDSECSEGDGDSDDDNDDDDDDDDDDDSHHFQNGGELTAADREWLRECQLKAEQVRALGFVRSPNIQIARAAGMNFVHFFRGIF